MLAASQKTNVRHNEVKEAIKPMISGSSEGTWDFSTQRMNQKNRTAKAKSVTKPALDASFGS